MTSLMDEFFIFLGLDSEELKQSPLRGRLYVGIVYCLGITTAFAIMILMPGPGPH